MTKQPAVALAELLVTELKGVYGSLHILNLTCTEPMDYHMDKMPVTQDITESSSPTIDHMCSGIIYGANIYICQY